MAARLYSMNPRLVLIITSIVIVLAVLLGSFLGSVYFAKSESPFVVSMARATGLPAARVGRVSVAYADYVKHVGAQRVFLSGPAAAAQGMAGEIGDRERAASLDRAIRIAAIDELASAADLVATPLDVERAYDGLVAQAGTSTQPGELQAFLRDQFGWDEKDFKQYVVRPAILEDALRAKSMRDTQDDAAFDAMLDARLKQADVVRYIRFPSLANQEAS
jgi:hypothetical protein